MKDIVNKLDEFMGAGALAIKLTGKSPSTAIDKELQSLFQKVIYHKEKDKIKAVDFVAHEEGLNKRWTKALKKYVKKLYK